MSTPEETKENVKPQPCPVPYQIAEDEIDLLEYGRVIWGGRWFIALFTGGCTLIAVLVTLFVLPVTYQSVSVLQPVAIDQSTLGKLSSLAGGLPSMLGIGGGDSNNQQLVDFLSSRNLKQRLIEKYELLPRLYEDDWDPQAKKWLESDSADQPSVVKALQKEKLKKIFTVNADKKTALITLTWVDEDPAFAALMLERVIKELGHYLEYEYETDAQRERIFTEEQLSKAKVELEFWERQVPSPNLSQGEIQRELLTSQLVYQELRKQLELAKIQEAKQVISFKVLDSPFVPEIKFKPKRALICAATLAMSGFLAVLVVFIRQGIAERRQGVTPAD